jgi:hypothetical protein
MNIQRLSRRNIAIWQRLVEGRRAFDAALAEFMADGVNRAGLIKDELSGKKGRNIAIAMLQYLKPDELIQLFPELLLHGSSAQGPVGAIRQAILSLPRDWVLANIEQVAEPILNTGTYDEYRRMLELYILLDRDMTFRLAQRAAQHPDPDIKEAGEDFLDKLMPLEEI